MGEANRRRAQDPYFGKIPKKGRGVVVCPPIAVDTQQNKVGPISTALDPKELRSNLLFFDRLFWPKNQIFGSQETAEEALLKQERILEDQRYTMSGDFAEIIAETHARGFNEKNQKEPGLWSISEGETSLFIRNKTLCPGAGVAMSMYQLIPVPDEDVPLQEVLEFKNKRIDELKELRFYIDECVWRIEKSEKPQEELNKVIERIDYACSNVIRAAKDEALSFRFSDVSVSYNLDPIDHISRFLTGSAVGSMIAMPITTGLLFSGSSLVQFKKSSGQNTKNPDEKAFRFVYDMHKELG